MEHSKAFVIASWTLRAIAAIILLQTLFFKFTGAKESVYIFTTLGMEPWGRIGSGAAELIASILLLLPQTVVFGAIMSLGVISGAIFFQSGSCMAVHPRSEARSLLTEPCDWRNGSYCRAIQRQGRIDTFNMT